MKAPQAESISDDQIVATYVHFEHEEEAPKGVILDPRGFTHTMGRAFESDANGTFEVRLT